MAKDTQQYKLAVSGGEVLVKNQDDGIVAEFCTEETASRFIACVNACAGISTEALEAGVMGELIEALGAMFKQFYYDNGGLEAGQKARKALNAVGWEWKKGDAPCSTK